MYNGRGSLQMAPVLECLWAWVFGPGSRTWLFWFSCNLSIKFADGLPYMGTFCFGTLGADKGLGSHCLFPDKPFVFSPWDRGRYPRCLIFLGVRCNP